jgi:hypothetical protein
MSRLLQDSVGILEGGETNETTAALEAAFSTTLSHVVAKGLAKSDFFYLMTRNSKFTMPFEKIDGLDYLKAQSLPPPREHFASRLSGRTILSEEEYGIFLETWSRLKIGNMFQLFELYLALDVTNLVCVLDLYFHKIFEVTRLYPSHFFTISSLALAAALLNSCNPREEQQRQPERTSSLRIPLLDEDTYHIFSEALIGGYSRWIPRSGEP